MAESDWCVVVAICKPESVATFLVEFYRFVEGIKGAENLHFLIRDRFEDEVVFSFRIFVEIEQWKTVKSKIAYKLKQLLSEGKFAINPDSKHHLFKYVAWSTERASEIGEERFSMFCDFLSRLSKVVVEKAEKNYFESAERVEIAHVMAWMLGCTEYGRLSVKQMEVGYYDRIEDKSCLYLNGVLSIS